MKRNDGLKRVMDKARKAAEADLSYYHQMTEKTVRKKELGVKHVKGEFGPEDCDVRFIPLGERMILVEWSVDHVGFGQLYLNIDKNGKLTRLDSETMQKPFIKALFSAAIDKAKLDA